VTSQKIYYVEKCQVFLMLKQVVTVVTNAFRGGRGRDPILNEFMQDCSN
jgi:hypothetical protein